jgi:REP element-mobilizing transposase RayT
MDRHWLLTWTTYGSWLPGDRRGFVGQLRDATGLPYIHNLPHTPCDADMPALEGAMRAAMKGAPIRLGPAQAEALVAQFRETAAYRGWLLLAGAVMANHVHLVVGVPGDPDPEKLLHDFKSYASRTLNRLGSRPVNGTWWTESGSKRKLRDVLAAVEYVRNQERPLVIWVNEEALDRGVDTPRPPGTEQASGVSDDPGTHTNRGHD